MGRQVHQTHTTSPVTSLQASWRRYPTETLGIKITTLLLLFLLGACIIQPCMSLAQSPDQPADQPVPRTDQNSLTAHAQLLDKAKRGSIDIYFEGDSITRRWGATDYPDLLANWKQNFFGWKAANFGWGADTIQNILWRLNNGELDGVHPKVIVLLAGTNNVGRKMPPGGDEAKVADITRGLKAIVDIMRAKAPHATILLMGIFPRNDSMEVMSSINKINSNLSKLADGRRIRYLNINDKLADKDGRLFDGMMNAGDKLHLTVKGYQVWADALKPIFTDLLGPPANEDHAPPPTGEGVMRDQPQLNPSYLADAKSGQDGRPVVGLFAEHAARLDFRYRPFHERCRYGLRRASAEAREVRAIVTEDALELTVTVHLVTSDGSNRVSPFNCLTPERLSCQRGQSGAAGYAASLNREFKL